MTPDGRLPDFDYAGVVAAQLELPGNRTWDVV